MRRQPSLQKREQRGGALLIFALILILAVFSVVLSQLNSSDKGSQRNQITTNALLQAKEALIGFAVTYRDSHTATNPGAVFGYLPCPDTNGDGVSDPPCGNIDVPAVGRLPWKTLGLSPLRDQASECLWYAVSGHAKDNPQPVVLNWDSPGQFVVQDAANTALAGTSPHELALAIVVAPRGPLGVQSRTPIGASECGGNNTTADYLEMLDGNWANPAYTGSIVLKVANAESVNSGTNNDQALWISSGDLFNRIKTRSDFQADINTLMDDLASYLNNLPLASLPVASISNKGMDTVISGYRGANTSLPKRKEGVLDNWQDNLLYAGGPSGNYIINGSPTPCNAALLFGGERTNRTVAPLTAQLRSTAAEIGDAAMYLEGENATTYPDDGKLNGSTLYDKDNNGKDIVRCITGLSSAQASFSNPADFANFIPTGVAVTPDATTTPDAPTVSIADGSGMSGGCFWFSNPIPLADNTLRAYYQFKFFYADAFALGAPGSDRGNGFTFQMVRSDIGTPNTCGAETAMGSLNLVNMWGSISYIVETDVRRDMGRNDPPMNHTAIMTNGNLTHAAGSVSQACNGTRSGCAHTPSNTFEESPYPSEHNQRIEIKTGCNAGCSACNPKSHPPSSTYARISIWVDCTDCNDLAADINRLAKPPTAERCTSLYSEMNSIYFGLTGGFRSGAVAGQAPAQGVTINHFSLRSD